MNDELSALPRLFTLAEVAERTGFNLLGLARDCRAGRVEHVHRGRDRLMTAEQVEKLVMAHTTTVKVESGTAEARHAEVWKREALKLARRRGRSQS